jgi:hypothetical protein
MKEMYKIDANIIINMLKKQYELDLLTIKVNNCVY